MSTFLRRLKTSLIGTRVVSLGPILNDLPSAGDRLKFFSASMTNLLMPVYLRRNPVIQELRFRRFSVQYRVGQGEISPYLEIKDPTLARMIDAPEVTDWTILDCGANIGLFCLFFQKAKRLVAVEPNPEPMKRLSHNLKANGLNAQIVSKAVSAKEGVMKMAVASSNTTQGTLSDEGDFEVPVTTIDKIVEELGLERVDLLKLDVEEHEIEALTGALASCRAGIIRRICAEFRRADLLAELDGFLEPLNFKRVGIIHDYNALYELQ